MEIVFLKYENGNKEIKFLKIKQSLRLHNIYEMSKSFTSTNLNSNSLTLIVLRRACIRTSIVKYYQSLSLLVLVVEF